MKNIWDNNLEVESTKNGLRLWRGNEEKETLQSVELYGKQLKEFMIDFLNDEHSPEDWLEGLKWED